MSGANPMGRAMTRLLLIACVMILGGIGVAFAQTTNSGIGDPTTNAAAAFAPNVWQQTARVVANPWATVALLFVGCLLIFIDLLTPRTWGPEGTLGVVCVSAVMAAHVSIGNSGGWIGVILALLGITLLLLETHVFPGQGVWAIGGLLCLFLGMFNALGGTHTLPLSLPVSSVLTIVSLVAFFAYLPKTALWKGIGAQIQQRGGGAGGGAFAGGMSLTYQPVAVAGNVPIDADALDYVGREGVVMTPLRPTGIAQFGQSSVMVVTEGDFLEPGARVVVTQVEGERIVVDPVGVAVVVGV